MLQNIFHRFIILRKKFNWMNAHNFSKKKNDAKKQDKKIIKPMRVDTEGNQPFVDKKPHQRYPTTKHFRQSQDQKPQKTHKIQRFLTTTGKADQSAVTIMKQSKTVLYIKQLVKTLWQIKEKIQKEYDELLSENISTATYKELSQLLATDYFRFRKATFNSVLDEYSNIIQGCQLLISKLTNNEKLSEKILVRDEQDFVLFFKFFFSKPYTLINLPAVRKIIKLLWDQFIFTSLTINAIFKNIKLWIYGIAAPLNPSMNKLHKYCSERSDQVSRFVTHKSNSHVYIGVNDSDSLCLTPLMVAVITRNIKAAQKLIKNGADLYCCPFTICSKPVTETIQQTIFNNKTMIRKQYGHKQRRQADVIQYLKHNKMVEWIPHVLCWQHFYNLKKFRKNTDLSDIIQMIPDCSFQIDWKQYRGMLCFKQLPSDLITVSKRQHNLRIDFHVKDIVQIGKKKGFYSLILKTQPKEQNKLYMISHNQKLIKNVLEDKDIKMIKQRYGIVMKLGNVYQPEVSQMKSIYTPEQNRFSSSFSTYYQNYVYSSKHVPMRFKNQKQYFRDVVDADFINYSQLEKDEMKAIINQNVVKIDKQKIKFNQSTCNVQIQWAQETLKLKHLKIIMEIAQLTFPQSLILSKMSKIFQMLQDPVYRSFKMQNKLPKRCKWSSEAEVNIQAELKNIFYCKVNESVFDLQVKAKEMNFQQIQEQVDMSHLQDTVYMDQMYSINASRFLGQSQKMLQLEDIEANKKFEELLQLQGIWSADDD